MTRNTRILYTCTNSECCCGPPRDDYWSKISTSFYSVFTESNEQVPPYRSIHRSSVHLDIPLLRRTKRTTTPQRTLHPESHDFGPFKVLLTHLNQWDMEPPCPTESQGGETEVQDE